MSWTTAGEQRTCPKCKQTMLAPKEGYKPGVTYLCAGCTLTELVISDSLNEALKALIPKQP
jgi:hypothetical protein